MPNQTIGIGKFTARHAEKRVRSALTDTRIVAIVGPRQSGKTTLSRRIANDDDAPFITLDDAQFRQFADNDPAGFRRGQKAAGIDEIQRLPSLILALKQAVDEEPRPGRYLITGSISPDSLAGRVETIELLPFPQAELTSAGLPGFLNRAFAGDFPSLALTGHPVDWIERVISGGFPEALSRTVPARWRNWLRAYARALTERDVSELAAIEKVNAMRRLIDHAAVSAGQLLNLSSLGSRLGIDGKTVDRWLTVLAHMFLVRRIRAWHRNELKGLVKTPKLQFVDSGLLAALRRVSTTHIAKGRQKLGPLLECLVHAELIKAAARSDEATTIRRYREKDPVEVDLVLERPAGGIVGIEVKAGATLCPKHFRGLTRLEEAAGDRFACSIDLHDGDRVQQTFSRLCAMPIQRLWKA